MSDIQFHEKNNLIVKSNALIEASYKLGINEHKMIRYVASKIKKDDSDFKTYRFKVKEFAEAIGVKGNGYYNELQKLSLDILSKPVKIKLEGRWIAANWFSYISYIETEGIVEVRFDAFFKPYFLNLQEKFTKYSFDQISSFKSSYSVRIFELCKQYERIGHRTIVLPELRRILGLDEGQYKNFSNFKQRILKYAIEEINIKTQLSVEIEEIKESRKVTAVKFIIKAKSIQLNEQMLLFDDDLENNLPSAESLKVREILNHLRLDEEAAEIENWITEYTLQGVLNAIKILKTKTDIDNKIDYLKGIMRNQKEQQTSHTLDTNKNKSIQDSLVDGAINEIKKKFSRTTEYVPEFMIKRTAISIFEEFVKTDLETASILWDTHKDEILDYIKLILEKNMKLKK